MLADQGRNEACRSMVVWGPFDRLFVIIIMARVIELTVAVGHANELSVLHPPFHFAPHSCDNLLFITLFVFSITVNAHFNPISAQTRFISLG